MSFKQRVECPRCGKIWAVPQGTTDIICNCHEYCQHGSKVGDCTLTPVSFSGQLGWPQGLHVDAVDEGDDVLGRQYYCSTHEVYSYKKPILIEVDWSKWFRGRAPKRLRMSKGEY